MVLSNERLRSAFHGSFFPVVSGGVERGAGREEMARQLRDAARGTVAARPVHYWEVVASSFVTRGRTFGQLSSYSEAGVERYRIEAVLDEVTTEICRGLHGRMFTVKSGLGVFARHEAAAEKGVDEFKLAAPWVRERTNSKGDTELWAKGANGSRRIASVVQSAMGTSGPNATGTFSGVLDAKGMEGVGVMFPPFHGLCRSTTIPEISAAG